MLGLLQRNKARLSPAIYEFIEPEHDSLSMGLRKLLGPDLSGPEWCVCRCRQCRIRDGEIDHTQEPRGEKSAAVAEQVVRDVVRKRKPAA